MVFLINLHQLKKPKDTILDNSKILKTDLVAMNEVQLILAEKRTSLAVMRTGLAVLVLPLSITSLLIATSEFYNLFKVLHFLIPLGILNLTLLIFGIYLIIKSKMKMRNSDKIIEKIKKHHSVIADFISLD